YASQRFNPPTWIQSVPPAVAGGYAVGSSPRVLRMHPPATAGGTGLYPSLVQHLNNSARVDDNRGSLQVTGSCFQIDPPGFLFRLKDRKRHPVKRFALVSFERLMTDLVTVIDTHYRAGPHYFEFDKVISQRHGGSIAVDNFHSHKRKIHAISSNRSAIWN